MFKQLLYSFCVVIILLKPCFTQAQSEGIVEIEKALADKNYAKADAILRRVIEKYNAARKSDSLVNYIFYVAKIEKAKSDANQAVTKLLLYNERIKKLSPQPSTLRQLYIETGEVYGYLGLNKAAYKANQDAIKYTLLSSEKSPGKLGQIENNLSTYAQRMGDLNLSEQHTRRALKYLLTEKNPRYENLYISYNGMGSYMWYASKIDSSLYYFTQALNALSKTERTPLNQFYRVAIVQNNVSALYGQKGKTTEAIQAMKSAIQNVKLFLSSKEPSTKKGTAVTFQFEATDNLAGFYKELGDLKQARELLEYSYQQKLKNLSANNPGIFISQILLGQLYFAMKQYDKSLQYLNNGLASISKADGDHLYYQADACNTLALLYDAKDDNKQAAHFYEKADSLYEQSLQGEYDDIYLDFLRNAALFYAENGDQKTGIAKANKGYNYVSKAQGPQTLMAFYQLLNLCEVYYLSGRFTEALAYSKKGLDVVNHIIKSSENLLDSIKIEVKKPKAILLKAKAEYALLKNKDVISLTGLLNELNEALSVVERRKTIINDANDIVLLMADQSDLLEFAKKITLDLYKHTNDQAYVDRIISLHESGIYNRIRSRLDKNDSLQFADIPPATRLKERQLKAAINNSFAGEGTHDQKMQEYFKATSEWNQHMEKMRVEHPRYYQMRYASIFKSLGQVQQAIPANTTLIRYFFIGKDLYALVADNKQKRLYPLENTGLEKHVASLSQYGMDAVKTGNILNVLYRQLWEPLAKNIHHKKIVIVPDGILYNLNFEILTQQKIAAFKELASKSLLANYTISYHYSLFLLVQKPVASVLTNNFIAFAPGFTDKLKEHYRSASKDSMQVDNGYLSLLPQPFTIGFATKAQQLLGGDIFINDQSTEASFKANAGKHKIIHIGTHAESNNDYPEFSRLIFAKNAAANEDDNSLFVDEIYNCDLTSHLTVLTACESGKPGYQDGEGMISLAHAFNYAGSESILTGLWKIDEQASALLLNLFYENLLKGLPKDEALRQAKLTYLQQAEGRMLAPQYWAGLVIMGDTSPVVLKQNNARMIWWIAGGLVLLLIGGYLVNKKRITNSISSYKS